MRTHNISIIEHLSPEPHDAASPVKLTYLDGTEAHSRWGSDVGGGGVLAWREENGDGSAFPYSPPTIELAHLSPRQFNLMLLQIGLTWADIQAEIDAMADPQTREVADVEFNKAGYFKRDHWLVNELAVELEFTDAELDTMWSYAADL